MTGLISASVIKSVIAKTGAEELAKTHLISSAEPLKERQDRVAACGKTVPNAEFRFFFEGELPSRLLEALGSITTCGKCMKRDLDGKYVYGIAAGERDGSGE
jgi:hypothetical protein